MTRLYESYHCVSTIKINVTLLSYYILRVYVKHQKFIEIAFTMLNVVYNHL